MKKQGKYWRFRYIRDTKCRNLEIMWIFSHSQEICHKIQNMYRPIVYYASLPIIRWL